MSDATDAPAPIWRLSSTGAVPPPRQLFSIALIETMDEDEPAVLFALVDSTGDPRLYYHSAPYSGAIGAFLDIYGYLEQEVSVERLPDIVYEQAFPGTMSGIDILRAEPCRMNNLRMRFKATVWFSHA